MSVKSRCPSCDASIVAREDRLGQRVRCPKCREPFVVGGGDAPSTVIDAASSVMMAPTSTDREPAAAPFVPGLPTDPGPVRSVARSSRSRRSAKKEQGSSGLAWKLGGAGAAVTVAALGLVAVLWIAGGEEAPPKQNPALARLNDGGGMSDRAAAAGDDAAKPAKASPLEDFSAKFASAEPADNDNDDEDKGLTPGDPDELRDAARVDFLMERGVPEELARRTVQRTKAMRDRGRVGTPPPPGQELRLPDLVKRVEPGVVRLVLYDESGEEVGLGSGFVVDRSGLVATNYHVIAMGDRAVAHFKGGEGRGEQRAVIGARAWDADRDLAVLQLESLPADVHVLPLSEALPPVGTDVVAVGHPGGFQFTTTTGIVSALHRTDQLPAEARDFLDSPADQMWIQTNATISGGNSGGPLLNLRGEVVGVNSWVVSDRGLGFAAAAWDLGELIRGADPEPTTLAAVRADGAGMGEQAVREFVDTLPEEVNALFTKHMRRLEEYAVALASADTPEDLEALQSEHPARQTGEDLLALAREQRGTDDARSALLATVVVARTAMADEAEGRLIADASKALLRDHAYDEELLLLPIVLGDCGREEAHETLRSLYKSCPHTEVRALSLLALASALGQAPDRTVAHADEAAAALTKAIDDYGDLVVQGQSIREAALPMKYGVENLVVGREPPAISGPDADGEPMSLKDYRGQVVLLDFFADWCPACTGMYPQERVLVRKYEDRPFVMLGVNGDRPGVLDGLRENGSVTWRTWADGPNGPIAEDYRVTVYPTLYLIDAEGRIRASYDGAPDFEELETKIEELVKEAEAAQ